MGVMMERKNQMKDESEQQQKPETGHENKHKHSANRSLFMFDKHPLVRASLHGRTKEKNKT